MDYYCEASRRHQCEQPSYQGAAQPLYTMSCCLGGSSPTRATMLERANSNNDCGDQHTTREEEQSQKEGKIKGEDAHEQSYTSKEQEVAPEEERGKGIIPGNLGPYGQEPGHLKLLAYSPV